MTWTKQSEYNGWSSHATWALVLHLDNDQDLYNWTLALTKQLVRAEGKTDVQLSIVMQEAILDMIYANPDADLIQSMLTDVGGKEGLNDVNWDEVWNHYRDTVEEHDDFEQRKKRRPQTGMDFHRALGKQMESRGFDDAVYEDLANSLFNNGHDGWTEGKDPKAVSALMASLHEVGWSLYDFEKMLVGKEWADTPGSGSMVDTFPAHDHKTKHEQHFKGPSPFKKDPWAPEKTQIDQAKSPADFSRTYQNVHPETTEQVHSLTPEQMAARIEQAEDAMLAETDPEKQEQLRQRYERLKQAGIEEGWLKTAEFEEDGFTFPHEWTCAPNQERAWVGPSGAFFPSYPHEDFANGVEETIDGLILRGWIRLSIGSEEVFLDMALPPTPAQLQTIEATMAAGPRTRLTIGLGDSADFGAFSTYGEFDINNLGGKTLSQHISEFFSSPQAAQRADEYRQKVTTQEQEMGYNPSWLKVKREGSLGPLNEPRRQDEGPVAPYHDGTPLDVESNIEDAGNDFFVCSYCGQACQEFSICNQCMEMAGIIDEDLEFEMQWDFENRNSAKDASNSDGILRTAAMCGNPQCMHQASQHQDSKGACWEDRCSCRKFMAVVWAAAEWHEFKVVFPISVYALLEDLGEEIPVVLPKGLTVTPYPEEVRDGYSKFFSKEYIKVKSGGRQYSCNQFIAPTAVFKDMTGQFADGAGCDSCGMDDRAPGSNLCAACGSDTRPDHMSDGVERTEFDPMNLPVVDPDKYDAQIADLQNQYNQEGDPAKKQQLGLRLERMLREGKLNIEGEHPRPHDCEEFKTEHGCALCLMEGDHEQPEVTQKELVHAEMEKDIPIDVEQVEQADLIDNLAQPAPEQSRRCSICWDPATNGEFCALCSSAMEEGGKPVQAAAGEQQYWELREELRVWERAAEHQGDKVPSKVLQSGTLVKVLRRFKLGHGGSPELAEVEYALLQGATRSDHGHGVVRYDDLRLASAGYHGEAESGGDGRSDLQKLADWIVDILREQGPTSPQFMYTELVKLYPYLDEDAFSNVVSYAVHDERRVTYDDSGRMVLTNRPEPMIEVPPLPKELQDDTKPYPGNRCRMCGHNTRSPKRPLCKDCQEGKQQYEDEHGPNSLRYQDPNVIPKDPGIDPLQDINFADPSAEFDRLYEAKEKGQITEEQFNEKMRRLQGSVES